MHLCTNMHYKIVYNTKQHAIKGGKHLIYEYVIPWPRKVQLIFVNMSYSFSKKKPKRCQICEVIKYKVWSCSVDDCRVFSMSEALI